MSVIAIPKEIIKKRDDLIILPRKEYEDLLRLKKVKEFLPTAVQKKALLRAEKNLKGGKTLSYNELVNKLGFTN